ncbi:DUF4232 domain-containing protein [Streptomyces pinistramenti]|uniref:DUF4232 domain-containing protein n=1 Tax=Streptomyces pinistramenti TaxID=2884812 RepID=UPI001D06D1D5|nr:DUF4232 domain-containing protein [Streptomyces pinistramenti]MCB5906526.1 DUF4232 domain-containing protein [Streptomyces pinistramenti]
MRTTRIRTTVLAAATAALALSLTACGGSDGADGTKSDASRSSSAGGAKTAGDGAEVNSSHTSGDQGTSGSGRTTATKARQCHGDEISYDVLHRFPKQQGEHLLITARNADTRPCWVTSYPSVLLGDASKALGHSSKDAPGSGKRITIRPGGKVYSAVNLFAYSAGAHTSTKLSIALRDQTGDTGPAVEHDAFDGKGAASKFSWSEADVTHWNAAKPYDF